VAFPGSHLAEEGRTLHAELIVREQLFKETMASNDPELLLGFLATYPEGLTSNQVRRRLRKLEAPAWRLWKSALISGLAFILCATMGIEVFLTRRPTSSATRAAQPLSSTEERALKPKSVFRECSKCPEMVVLPAGEFWMGSPEREDERPRHQVKIANPL